MDEIFETYKKEQRAINRFKVQFCPMHILLARACKECPAKDFCCGGNTGMWMGIDHQTLRKDGAKGARYVFRPYKNSFGKEKRANLEKYCDYFKLKLEIRDENTYRAEAEGRVYTVIISPTKESLRFRKGGEVIGTPWCGKDSPIERYREKYRK